LAAEKDKTNRAPKASEDSLCYSFALEKGSGHLCLMEEKYRMNVKRAGGVNK